VIEAVEEVTSALVEAFARLLPQLGSSPFPDDAALREVVNQQDTSLLIARDPELDTILGVLTLIVPRTPTGPKAVIEDVVVDEQARGRGAATLLVERAIDIARSLGCPWVQLTSRPSRVAANRLYQQLGFVARETNVYRRSLE
jgi:ribosomal protein S18 acetylase RimI-like enzyme